MKATITRKSGNTTVHFRDHETGMDRQITTDDQQAWSALKRWCQEADKATGRA